MKKLKLTDVQVHVARQAYHELSKLLRDIKTKPLEDQALSDMKTLEESVQHLECFLLGK